MIARALALLAAIAVLGAACGDGDKSPSGGLSGSLTIFAASSLTDAFTDIGAAFEVAHPGVSVEFNFAGSPTLVTQLDQGAEADALATADEQNMSAAYEAGLVVSAGEVFAQNRLAVIVPSDNPAGLTTPYELGRSGLRLVLASPEVPAGRYARQLIEGMGAIPEGGPGFAKAVFGNVVSEEPNVKAVVAKVQLGEADAGIVYVTDVTPDIANDVTLVAIPDEINVTASYPIATIADAPAPGLASAFIEFVLSPEGQAILQQYGFLRVQ